MAAAGAGVLGMLVAGGAVVLALAVNTPTAAAAPSAGDVLRLIGTNTSTTDIAVTQFGFGAQQAPSTASGGAGAGRVQLETLTIVKRVDGTSPALFKALAEGTSYAEAELLLHNGSVPEEFVFSPVMVESIAWSGGGASAAESVSFGYGGLQIASGSQSGSQTTSFGWNQVTNAPIVGPVQ